MRCPCSVGVIRRRLWRWRSGAVCAAAEAAGYSADVNLSSAVCARDGAAGEERRPYDRGGQTHRQLDYCSAKGRGGGALFAKHAAKTGGRRVIQLRPFTIYGPRSRLFGRILAAMKAEEAWLLNEGERRVQCGLRR